MLVSLVLSTAAIAQQPPPSVNGNGDSDVGRALQGNWAGYLEYRDYSEPPASTKRVQLPTWLTVSQTSTGLSLHYIYDDGPGKVVDETEQIVFDVQHGICTIEESAHSAEVYHVEGFKSLRAGLGVLNMTGTGRDNDKSAEECIALTIRRNIVERLLEARPAGSSEPYAFRHVFRLTRVQPPAVTASRE